MNRFATSLITKPVVLEQERAVVGVIEDLVIDPANGNLLGFLVREGFGKKKKKALAIKDLVGIGTKFIIVKSYSVLGDIDEIVRIKKVIDQRIHILKNRVFTVSGSYLGRVADFSIDVELSQLTRLYVSPGILGALKSQHIIGYQQIISIEEDKITVEDATLKLKSKVRVMGSREPEAV